MSLLLLALLTGLIVSWLSGNVLEAWCGMRARLAAPHFPAGNHFQSMLKLLLAGPYFLIGEWAADRDGKSGAVLTTALAVVFACVWATAAGVLWIEAGFSLSVWWKSHSVAFPVWR